MTDSTTDTVHGHLVCGLSQGHTTDTTDKQQVGTTDTTTDTTDTASHGHDWPLYIGAVGRVSADLGGSVAPRCKLGATSRGSRKLLKEQRRARAIAMRHDANSYRAIARALGVSVSVAHSYCQGVDGLPDQIIGEDGVLYEARRTR